MKLKKVISVILTFVLTVLLFGNVVDVKEVYAANNKLSKVTSLTQKSPYSTSSIKMSWKKQKGASGYEVYCSTSAKGKYKKVKTTTATSYKQDKLVKSKTYYFKVRAYKKVKGKKIYGSFSSVKAMGTKSQAPSTNVYAGVKKIKIEWNKISGINGYEIAMSTSKGGVYKTVKKVDSKTTSYLVSNLEENKEYFFKVRAYRSVSGKKIYSSWSGIKSAVTKKEASNVVRVTGVNLNIATLTMTKGESYTLNATVSPNNANNKSVSWSSSNTSVATVNGGKVTAVGKGKATITVKTNDGGKVASCVVNVNDPDTKPQYIHVDGIILNSEMYNVERGTEITLIATVTPENATNKAVEWSSSDTSVATVKDGKVTTLLPGYAVITAKTVDGEKIATCSISVYETLIFTTGNWEPTDNVSVTGVSLNTSSVTLNKGGSTTLTATVKPSNATNKSVSWSSSNTSVATVSGGKVTAVGKGTATITVKTANGGKTATCTVTVKVPVTGVSITNKKDLPLDFNSSSNNTYQCNVSVSPSDASNKSVTWTSSDSSVASVNSSGKVTALKRGTATITVKTADGAKTDSFKVYVYKTNPEVPGGGNVYLKLKLASNQSLVMDVENGTTANGTKVKLWNANGSDAQFWQFHNYKDKYGGLAGVPKCNTGSFVLDANRGGNNLTDPLKVGCAIDLWTIGQDNAASMWELVRVWDDSYIIKLINSNLVVGTTSATAGTQLTLKTFNVFDTNQRWFVEGVTVSNTNDYASKLNALRNTSGYKAGDSFTGSFDNASQCHGWALMVGNNISGRSARSWGVSNTLSGVKVGDIIRYENASKVGHTIVVIGVSGDTIIYADCNGNGGYLKIAWDQKVSKSAGSIFGYPFAYRYVAP